MEQCDCKKYSTCKEDYSWNPRQCICEKVKYLKSTVDNSVNLCEEIINTTVSVSTNVTKYYTDKHDKYCMKKCDNCYNNKYHKYYIDKCCEKCVNKIS